MIKQSALIVNKYYLLNSIYYALHFILCTYFVHHSVKSIYYDDCTQCVHINCKVFANNCFNFTVFEFCINDAILAIF